MLYGWKHLTDADREAIARGAARGQALGGPYFLEIHPTNRCNARCFFCFTQTFRQAQSLPGKRIEALLRQGAATDLRAIRLSGGGEPLVHPDIGQTIDLCGELGIAIGDLTTNGIRLEPFARQIVDATCDQVFVSLNEPNASLYERTMRVGAEAFQRATQGVRALCRARDDAPPEKAPQVQVQFFLGAHNLRKIAAMYDLGLDLGADRILIKTMRQVSPEHLVPEDAWPQVIEDCMRIVQRDSRPDRLTLRFDLERNGEFVAEVAEEQERLAPEGRRINPIFDLAAPRRYYCYMPWYGPVLAATGRLYPCCVLHEVEGKELGDLGDGDLAALWHGPAFRRLRRQMHQVILTRGCLRYSQRFLGAIVPMCIPAVGCYFSLNLCDEAFYAETAKLLEGDISPWRRAAARLRNRAIAVLQGLR